MTFGRLDVILSREGIVGSTLWSSGISWIRCSAFAAKDSKKLSNLLATISELFPNTT